MPRLPDLVRDSNISTEFHDSLIVHTFHEINEAGRRSSRKEYWKHEKPLGRGGFGQVRLEKCITGSTQEAAVRAVKIIHKGSTLDFNRELETIAKFSNRRVSCIQRDLGRQITCISVQTMVCRIIWMV